jgi:hypothetical protein
VDWWPDQGLHEWLNNVQDSIPGALPRTIWPVKIRGKEIGTCRGIVDLIVHTGQSMTVWAFSKHGLAKSWRINDGNNAAVKSTWVARDGTVREFEEGDLDPNNASLSRLSPLGASPLPLKQESFDGTASMSFLTTFAASSSLQTPVFEWDRQSCSCDSDTDVIMELPSPRTDLVYEYRGRSRESIEAVAFLYHREGNLYRSSRGSGHSFDSIGSDFVEGLTGITRIDVEIR